MESNTAALEDLLARRDAAEAAALDAYAARTAAGPRALQELRTANDEEYRALRRKCVVDTPLLRADCWPAGALRPLGQDVETPLHGASMGLEQILAKSPSQASCPV
jgi:hypothetical protein